MSSKSGEELVRELELLVQQLPEKISEDDENLSYRVYHASRKLSSRFESTFEATFRQTWAPLDVVVLRIATDLDLFSTLSQAEGSMTFEEISSKTKADPRLLKRIMTYLASIQAIDQIDSSTYKANRLTREYTTPTRVGNVVHSTDISLSAWEALPEFLRRTQHKMPDNPRDCAWQLGKQTDHTFFEWLAARTDLSDHFNNYMQATRERAEDVLADNFPSRQIFEGSTAEDVIFVDVGGGNGHQCLNLRQTYPKERGRVVLQDLPEVIPKTELPDVEVMAHDMLQPQPIKGARVYYFRGVLHDHPDQVCSKFLAEIVKVMTPHSRLLVHDNLVPEFGASELVTKLDIAMMAQFGALERTDTHMKQLLQPLGLEVVAFHKYGPASWIITEAKLA